MEPIEKRDQAEELEANAVGAKGPGKRGRRRLLFAVAAVILGLMPAIIGVPLLHWIFVPRLSPEAAVYQELTTKRTYKKPVTVNWPEHPAGRMTLDGGCPHYHRMWEMPAEKPPHVKRRVLVMGDSHVDGFVPQEENLVSLMDQVSTGVQVVNGAISGWSIVDVYRHFTGELRGAKYDDVVYVLNTGNDFNELFGGNRYQLQSRDNGASWSLVWVEPPRYANYLQSLIYCMNPDWVSLTPSQRRACRAYLMWAENPGSIDQVYAQAMYFQDEPGAVAEAEKRMRAGLAMMRDAVAARGGRFHVVVLPTKFLVEPGMVKDVEAMAGKRLGLREESLRLDAHFREVALRICRELGIPALDLLPVLKSGHDAHPDRAMFWRGDFHLGTWGHATAAPAIAGFLGFSHGRK